MRTINTKVLSLLVVFTFAANAFSEVTIDFEGLGAERDNVTSLFVTDPDTGYSTTVEFFLFQDTTFPIATTGRPMLVEEGGVDHNDIAGFAPGDTPFGETLGNGNDWMLGNGQGNADNFLFIFTGNQVADLSIEVIDFRADGPFSGGTPGSDTAYLRTFDEMNNAFPVSLFTVTDPRPVDGVINTLSSGANRISLAMVQFDPTTVDAGVVVDNLTFTVVPEPGAGSLFAVALGLIGFLRRK
ncbi:MAG: PEP-CTERM sorting domain-containing protein [Planctomycetota bacterium]